jgi:mono/diheme cytochrome c family protein
MIITTAAMLVACGTASRGQTVPSPARASAKRGQALFEYTCEACHYANSTVARAGPGLQGLYKHNELRNGAVLSDMAVARLIREGTGLMPGYHDKLSEQQMRDLLAFLRTL